MTRDPIWDAMKERSREKFNRDRDMFYQQALRDDDGGWTKYTDHHWGRRVNGHVLDYWPSRKKFRYKGITQRGDVYAFINKTTNETPA